MGTSQNETWKGSKEEQVRESTKEKHAGKWAVWEDDREATESKFRFCLLQSFEEKAVAPGLLDWHFFSDLMWTK